MNRKEEISEKLHLVRAMLKEKGLDGVIIKRQADFSWITAGGRGFIGLAGDAACGMILVTLDDFYLAANNIEGPRLMAEELPSEEIKLLQTDWWEDGKIEEKLKKEFGNLSDDIALDSWFKSARVNLLPSETERYRQLGTESAQALENACKAARQGMTEWEIAGLISAGLWARGIEPITLLVAADDRSLNYRHYVPTQKCAEEGFIASICARRGGLIVSATRLVGFNMGFARDYRALLEVEKAAFEATIPGATLGTIMDHIKEAYDKNGFPEEWKNHHQGGMTGYLAREYRADSESGIVTRSGQAFAWNPSVRGAKCEDTVLVLPEGGVSILTPCSDEWPSVEIGKWKRPDVLYR